jgi:hypothetical protein
MVDPLLVILFIAGIAWAIPTYIMEKKAKKRILELEAENHKLANHILAAQNERLLLPEDIEENGSSIDMTKVAQTVAKAKTVEAETQVVADKASTHKNDDHLLDMIELMDLTGVEAAVFESREVAIFRFGEFAVRDAPGRNNWNPDILYKDVWVGVCVEAECQRIRKIIDRKLVEAAARGLDVLVRIQDEGIQPDAQESGRERDM